jgi:hypothetical protein
MSLDFYLVQNDQEVFSSNITHNLNKMAEYVGIYQVLWRPEEIKISKAKDCIPLLSAGLIELVTHRTKCKKFDSPNGWGLYEHFVPFVTDVLFACAEYPEADVKVSR